MNEEEYFILVLFLFCLLILCLYIVKDLKKEETKQLENDIEELRKINKKNCKILDEMHKRIKELGWYE